MFHRIIFILLIVSSPSRNFYRCTGCFQSKINIACRNTHILGDQGADKGGEGKSKRAEKYIWNEEKWRTARRALLAVLIRHLKKASSDITTKKPLRCGCLDIRWNPWYCQFDPTVLFQTEWNLLPQPIAIIFDIPCQKIKALAHFHFCSS